MPATAYAHIELDDRGIPFLTGTRTKVIEVILDHVAWGLNAEQIHKQHPHLSIGSIHSALAYFYDHQPAIEEEIKGQLERVDLFFASRPQSPVSNKLKALREAHDPRGDVK